MIKVKLNKQEVEALANFFKGAIAGFNSREIGYLIIKEILAELVAQLQQKLLNTEQKKFSWKISRVQQLTIVAFATGVSVQHYPYEAILLGRIMEVIDRSN